MKKNWHIGLAAASCISFLLWLSSCTRLTYDDYLFAACFKGHSFFEAIKILSNTHTFRWTTFLLQDLMFGVVPGEYFPTSIFIFFLCLYGLWIQQLGRLISTAVWKFLTFEVETILSLSLSTLFVTSLYFSASQAIENFTFSGAVCDRLLPLLFITMALNLLLKPDHGWSTYLKLGALALLIAGTAENNTVSLLIAISLYAAWKWMLKKEKVPGALIFFMVQLIIFLAMELLSPGSNARYEAEKVYHFTCGDDNVYCADSFSLFLSRFFQGRQVFVLPFLLVFFAGALSLSQAMKNEVALRLKRTLAILALIAALVIAFHYLSAEWIFGCYGPMRLWLPVNVLLTLLACCAALYLGCKMNVSAPRFFLIGSGMVVAVMAFYFARHYEATSAYRSAYDQRVSRLRSEAGADTLVEVESLPNSDLVVEGDIMRDENDDVNRDFARTYGLSFKVRKK